MLSFIEQKCIVFDPEEENKLAYTEVFEEYGSLVEMLLESFIEDLGINAVSFVKVCDAFKSKNPQATTTVLEQVYAAQDYSVFKSMMTQKNIELELQALSLLQQRSGQIPDIMQPGAKTSVAHSNAQIDNEEERILQEVMQKSKEEYDQMTKSKKKASHVNEAMDKSLAGGKEVENLKIQQKKEEEVLQKTLKLAISEGPTSLPPEKSSKSPKPQSGASSKAPSMTSLPKSPTPKSPTPSTTSAASTKTAKSPVSSQDAAASWLLSAKAEAAESRSESRASNLSNADPSDIEKRAQYLKQQRDMLIARKKSAREKSLDAFEKSQPTARPKSSRAARQATQGDVKVDAQVDEKKLAMRKALAECLKKEVIDK